jgi:formylglycine-generating enzyme required for sulfatase activity
VPGFAIERHDVTNGRFLEFVEAGGYRDARWWTAETGSGVGIKMLTPFWERIGEAWFWRGMFG